MTFESQLLENASIQLIDGDRGTNYPKQEHFRQNGYCLFLSAKNVTSTGFEFSETTFIDTERDALLRAGKLQRGDIVLTTRGTIGNVAYYSEDIEFDHVRINSGMIILRADATVWNRRFLDFLFASNYMQEQITALTSGSAVPQLPARDLKKFKLPKIKKETQDYFEKLIGDFTDKIAFNRRINQTLEAMAQAIFRAWFVDFEPVKAKIAAKQEGRDPLRAAMSAISGKPDAELDALPGEQFAQLAATAALFPDEMEESELGEIPRGWDVQRVGNLLELVYGKALKSTDRKEGTVPVYGSGGITGYHDAALVPRGSIIVGRKGTVGSLYWEDEPFFPIDTTYYVRPLNVPLTYCYYAIQTLGLDKMNTDAAVPGLNRENVYRLELIKPDSLVLQKFDVTITTLRKAIRTNLCSSKSLASLRETLLPKLLSGELSVENIPPELEATA